MKMTIKYKWKMTSTRLSKTNINKIIHQITMIKFNNKIVVFNNK